jgi:dTDP-4-dehydrorhamnose reductase
MKTLLFGCNGQVGWELQRSLAPLGEVIALDRNSAQNLQLCGDLADLEGIADTVRRVRPDVIVNAAAYTTVDKAETEQALAHAVNAAAPGVLASAAEAAGAWLVHYSTDYVFDGSGTKPWQETDSTGPLNVYGATKLQGEQAIAARSSRYLVLRTSWVYAARGGNFGKTMLRLAREREELSVVDDQFGAPTGADLLADLTAHMVRRVTAGADDKGAAALAGIYHAAASGETSWHGYARFVVERSLRNGVALKTLPDRVRPVPSSAYPTPAARPQNSRLSTVKLQQAFGLRLPEWQEGVARMLNEVS